LRQTGRHCDLLVPGRGSGCALPNQPAGWDFFDRSKSRGFVDDIVNAPSVESAQRFFLFAATAMFVFVVAWLAWYWQTALRFMESTDDAYVGGEVTTLSAKVAGFIQTVTIADNQSVKAGDLLLTLEDRDYRAQLARAEASVAAQQSALANIDANRRMHHAVIEQASAVVAGACRRVGPRQIRLRPVSNIEHGSIRFPPASRTG
jgi:membrane fusion protein (multidrug efflux system)